MLVSGHKNAIIDQRDRLTALLGKPMFELAGRCAGVMDERASLEALLRESLAGISGCKHLYVLDANGLQLTNNITRDGDDPDLRELPGAEKVIYKEPQAWRQIKGASSSPFRMRRKT